MSGQPRTSQSRLSRRSAARTAVVWDALQAVLADVGEDREAADVVDVGGGTGGLAVRLAERGHRVTVIDPSPDALATLDRRAEESGVAELVTARQGDLDSLAGLVPETGVGLVLCHGVLEIVEDPGTALGAIADVLSPGGALSLLVNQRHAAVVARAMAGHFAQAQALLDERERSDRPRRFTVEEVSGLLDDAGLDVVAVHGVRVFTDLVPSSLVDLEPGAAAALAELEQSVATRPEYLPLATQLHLLARRPR